MEETLKKINSVKYSCILGECIRKERKRNSFPYIALFITICLPNIPGQTWQDLAGNRNILKGLPKPKHKVQVQVQRKPWAKVFH